MILIITGDTHTGKTTLAHRLMAERQVPYVSMDHIKMGLIRSGMVDASPMDGDEDITAWLWPVIREMVLTAQENRQDLIVEGCYVDFEDVRELADVRLAVLVMSEDYIRENFEVIAAKASVTEQRLDDSWMTPELLIAGNARFAAACAAAGLEPTLIEDDWERSVEGLVANRVGIHVENQL